LKCERAGGLDELALCVQHEVLMNTVMLNLMNIRQNTAPTRQATIQVIFSSK